MNEKAEKIIDVSSPSLFSLFWIFLKIGSTAFGGYMALITVVKNYLVDREKLLTDEALLDGISLATLLPGPVAVNVVVYSGYRISGLAGALTCAIAVILPSFFLILGLSYAYFRWGEVPAVNHLFQGVLPAIAAIIVATAFKMGKQNLNGLREISIAIVAMASLIFVDGFYVTILIIFLSGFFGFILFRNEFLNNEINPDMNTNGQRSSWNIKKYSIIFILIIALVAFTLSLNMQTSLEFKLLTTFSSMSVLLFGGGFVFIPLMQETVVEAYQWVTHKEFIDAIAMGQITPGPILISATFIGYKMAGVTGAVISTIGMFVPPAVIMLICSHYLEKIKKSPIVQSIMKGLRCAVIGMIVSAVYIVMMTAEKNIISLLLFISAIVALLKFKLEVVWIIPVAGLIGLVSYI